MHVSKTYGKERGINDVTFDVQPGEVFGFLGPNGAGKSTTINAILDLLHPDSGSIAIFGLDHHSQGVAARQRVGYLSGDMETDPTLTGRQYLQFAASLYGGVEQSTIDELVARLKCQTNKKIKHLSRGNRQKIGLVAALMSDPDLLILDEPTSGLDPLIQAEFNQILLERKERGQTTFMSSHVLSEVQSICDRVGFIRDGQLITVASMSELLLAAARCVTVVFESAAPDTRLKDLDGISEYKEKDKQRTFKFTGDYNQLLRVLNLKPIVSLEVAEPELEQLFMSYYEETSHA